MEDQQANNPLEATNMSFQQFREYRRKMIEKAERETERQRELKRREGDGVIDAKM